MELKNNRGITLLILTITITVLLIVTSIVIYDSTSQLGIKYLNNLYSDFDSIDTKISDYYLKNNSLPIFEDNTYLDSINELRTLLKINGGTGEEINPNDNGPYYVINLSKLENLTLNYGREYKDWNIDSFYENYQDLYIINKVTHQIYYPKGIKYKGDVYFTPNLTNEVVNQIQSSRASEDGIDLVVNQSKKSTVNSENKVIVDANITLNLSSDYKTEDLQYCWQKVRNTGDKTYTKFSLDESKSATLTSKLLEDNTEYYLYVKIFDTNGYEHIIEQVITL